MGGQRSVSNTKAQAALLAVAAAKKLLAEAIIAGRLCGGSRAIDRRLRCRKSRLLLESRGFR